MNQNMNAFPNNMFPFNQNQFNNQNMNNMNNNNNFFPNLINNQFQMMPMMINNPMMPMMNINQMMQMMNNNQMMPMMNINPMMQMNQMMMPNMDNQNNNNMFNMNQSQKLLVDKIIEFYQKNGRKYMDYSEPNQIKHLLNNLDTNSPLLKEGNDIDDPLSYVNDKKKVIKFINHDFKIYNVKVPISIDKKTLYDIAGLYKTIPVAKTLLIYMNCILHNDESSIDCIGDGDFVIIIENIYYLDDTYYNSLNNINYTGKKKNVTLEIHGSKRNMIVPSDTKLYQLYKAFIFKFGCGFKFIYLYDGKDINEQDERDYLEGYIISFYEYDFVKTYINILGKKIKLKLDFIDNIGKIKYGSSISKFVGVYNSTKEFTQTIEFQEDIKIKRFYLGNKEINLEENRSFFSLGIKEDAYGKILFIENHN